MGQFIPKIRDQLKFIGNNGVFCIDVSFCFSFFFHPAGIVQWVMSEVSAFNNSTFFFHFSIF